MSTSKRRGNINGEQTVINIGLDSILSSDDLSYSVIEMSSIPAFGDDIHSITLYMSAISRYGAVFQRYGADFQRYGADFQRYGLNRAHSLFVYASTAPLLAASSRQHHSPVRHQIYSPGQLANGLAVP